MAHTNGMAANEADTLKRTRRWHRLTPGRFLLVLLALEGFLLASERFRWFACNKGYAVLAAVGAVGLALLLLLLWLVVALVFRWRFQFGIRSLLVLSVAVAIPCSWFAVRMQEAREQREAVEAIRALGGSVEYDDEFDRTGDLPAYRDPRGPAWLRKFLGADFFAGILGVEFDHQRVTDADLKHLERLKGLQYVLLDGSRTTDVGLERLARLAQLEFLVLQGTEVTDAGLEHLKKLNQLRILDLRSTRVTDAGLEYLAGMPHLGCLYIEGTQVTDEGVKRHQQALPNCSIHR